MSEDHIGVQINGVLYVKFEDAKKLREGWDEADAEIEKLRAALRLLVSSTYSHLDGRDLLGELHPRNTLDIKRRVDGAETWFEGDWLTDLMDARNIARAALGEKE